MEIVVRRIAVLPVAVNDGDLDLSAVLSYEGPAGGLSGGCAVVAWIVWRTDF